MIRDQFFKDELGYLALTQAQQLYFNGAWMRVLDAEEKTGLSLDNPLTKEEYIQLLSNMKIRFSGSFQNYKSNVLMVYVRYLITNECLPAEQGEILASVQIRRRMARREV